MLTVTTIWKKFSLRFFFICHFICEAYRRKEKNCVWKHSSL